MLCEYSIVSPFSGRNVAWTVPVANWAPFNTARSFTMLKEHFFKLPDSLKVICRLGKGQERPKNRTNARNRDDAACVFGKGGSPSQHLNGIYDHIDCICCVCGRFVADVVMNQW